MGSVEGDIQRNGKHNPYAQVGSGSLMPPEYVDANASKTASKTVFRFMGKAVLVAGMAPHCWGSISSVTPAELLAGTRGFRPAIRAEVIHNVDQPAPVAKASVLLPVEEQIKLMADWLNPGGMSAVASLLRVSRPTIYKWLDGVSGIREENQKRLAQLNEVVSYWREQVNEPMPHGAIRRHLPSSVTLFDLLTQPAIDMGAVHEAVNLLSQSYKRSLASIARLDATINAGKPANN